METITINAYCTIRNAPEPDISCENLNRRDRSDPELAEHLKGFMGYVQQHSPGVTQSVYDLLRHIGRVQVQYSFQVDPNQLLFVGSWALEANAVLFYEDGTVRNPHTQILVSPIEGASNKDATLPYPSDAVQRKKETEGFLSFRELEAASTLPPVIGEGEVVLRSAKEVAERALALFVVALRAESLATGKEIPVDELRARMPLAFDYLSPAEKAFLANPDEQAVIQFAWRYEALFVLLWALGVFEEMPFAGEICDVPAIAEKMIGLDQAAFMNDASLLDASKILDALDLQFRLHWIVRQAQVDGTEVPAGVDGGVVMERHHALNWLVRFEDADWDDVDVPT